jgi:hypothetical protein
MYSVHPSAPESKPFSFLICISCDCKQGLSNICGCLWTIEAQAAWHLPRPSELCCTFGKRLWGSSWSVFYAMQISPELWLWRFWIGMLDVQGDITVKNLGMVWNVGWQAAGAAGGLTASLVRVPTEVHLIRLSKLNIWRLRIDCTQCSGSTHH